MPSSKDEALAQAHIEEIWRERTQDENNRNIRDLQHALELLSKDLYQKQTHFLLELLQNADDNQYNHDLPSLTLGYTKGGFYTNCNEVGFSKQNVEAICRIGQSTKSGSDRQKGYIGEKGIGFKSIFKVADIVWILSGPYSFKFDATTNLGMITPVWSKFPHEALAKGTSMLREIRLTLPALPTRTLRRQDKKLDDSSSVITLTENGTPVSEYLIFRHAVQGMPAEEKRPGVTESEVLLAFPTATPSEGHKYPTQQVYAFLPIQDYGFTFLIQADFLLQSNRGGIIIGSPWNEKLLSSIPKAFTLAVERFNKTNMRSKWLPFVPIDVSRKDSFSSVRHGILTELKGRQILQCENGEMALPLSVRYVSHLFTFSGVPLLQNPRESLRNLAPIYLEEDWTVLQALGVREMDLFQFLLDLQDLLKDGAIKIDAQTEKWHSRLAEILCMERAFEGNTLLLESLRIIPLRDKRWVSAMETRDILFFPAETPSRIAIPLGIELLEIDPGAMTCPYRRELFWKLGAKQFAVHEIQKAIERRHTSLMSADILSDSALVSHARFLFHNKWKNPGNVDLWVATKGGGRCRASKAYFTSFGTDSPVFPVLHEAYRVKHEPEKGWDEWLKCELHVWDIPRMAFSQKPLVYIPSTPFGRSRSIFQCIEYLLGKEGSLSAYEIVHPLRMLPIFPITRGERDTGQLSLETCEPKDTWFIADRPHFTEAFQGILPLFALEAADSANLGRFFGALNINDRLLSKVATCKPRPGLAITSRDDCKDLLLSKLGYISRLIPAQGPEPLQPLKLLREIRVHGVDEVDVTWIVGLSSSESNASRADKSSALIIEEEGTLHLYIRNEDVNAGKLPFELAEQISQWCGIPSEHTGLLWTVLLENDNGRIEKTLARRGFMRAFSESTAHNQWAEPRKRQDLPPRREKNRTAQPIPTLGGVSKDSPDLGSRKRPDSTPTSGTVRSSSIKRLLQSSTGSRPDYDDIGPFNSKFKRRSGSNARLATPGASLIDIPQEWGGIATDSDNVSGHVPLREIAAELSLGMEYTKVDDQHGDTAQLPDFQKEHRASKLTGQVNIIFVPGLNDLSRLDSEGRSAKGITTLPARMQLLDTGERTIFIARNSFNSIDHEPAFLGETFVSQFLESVLGRAYVPERHWTSPMRTRLGHGPFLASTYPAVTSFTLDGNSGNALTEFLINKSCSRAKVWQWDRPDYHIDVQTTTGDIGANFSWSPLHFDMARRYRVRRSSQQQDHIYILIRVSNIYENPSVLMFVDPWSIYESGDLQLQAQSDFAANLRNDSRPPIELTSPNSRSRRQQGDRLHPRASKGFWSMLTGQSSSDDYHGGVPSEVRLYIWHPLVRDTSMFIRLLRLLPGEGAKDLRGELEVSSIADKPYFIAISYAWGSGLQPFSLRTSEGRIPLTTSLYLALRRMRQTDKPIRVWADAICINQADNCEKSFQIGLMPHIFRSAARVHAWIGDEEDHSQDVLTTLGQILNRPTESSTELSPQDSQPSFDDQQIPPVEHHFWNDLARLLERKWFRRIWVVQEIALARDITLFCGSHETPWDQFYDAVMLCFEYAERSGSDFVLPRQSATAAILHLANFRRHSRTSGEFVAKHALLVLFEVFQLTEATRTRDKLFALLGLANDANLGAFYPDYKGPLEAVILRYARGFVLNGQVMELLYRSRLSSDPRFPSWIPDWTSAPYPKTLSSWECFTQPGTFTAATHLLAGSRVTGRTLSLQGYLVDSVQYVGTCPSSTTDFTAYLKEIYKQVDKFFPDLSPEEATNVKWRLPIGDARSATRGDWGNDLGLASYKALTEYLQLEDRDTTDPQIEARKIEHATQRNNFWTESDKLRSHLAPYLATALDFAELFPIAIVCVTRERNIGIVPANTQKGDRIAIFHGSKVPFIIRQSEELEGHFNVVGECYFPSLMHGEYENMRGDRTDIKLV
ncbi:hypothetical protein BBP40_001444 [Aspergillus hancockii]|nr:hypothetical protein BBP40_001444 [Aspergillus hancockii]